MVGCPSEAVLLVKTDNLLVESINDKNLDSHLASEGETTVYGVSNQKLPNAFSLVFAGYGEPSYPHAWNWISWESFSILFAELVKADCGCGKCVIANYRHQRRGRRFSINVYGGYPLLDIPRCLLPYVFVERFLATNKRRPIVAGGVKGLNNAWH